MLQRLVEVAPAGRSWGPGWSETKQETGGGGRLGLFRWF